MRKLLIIRRDVWACPTGRDPGQAGRPALGTRAEPVPDAIVRSVHLAAGGPVLPAGRARLLPRRQERPLQSSTGCSPTPRAGRSRSACCPAPRPGRVYRDRAGRAGQVPAGQDGHDRGTGARSPPPASMRSGNWMTSTAGSPRCTPRPSASWWPMQARSSSACSTSRTWPRSAPRASPASGWLPPRNCARCVATRSE